MRKTALITGGTRGIGLGIAKSLAEAGYDIALNGQRPEEAVTEVMSEVAAYGVKVIYCQGNIGDASGRQYIFDKIKSEFGHLNVLINNAGVAPRVRKDFLEIEEEDFDYLLDINLKGVVFLSQYAAKWMIAEKQKNDAFVGCIVNISSISATVASVNRGEYCISKAGIAMLTKLLAVKLSEHEIPVYEVRPGIIITDMTSGVLDKYNKMISDGVLPIKRLGSVEEIGTIVKSLVTQGIPYTTGQVIIADGGMGIERL